MKVHFLGTAAFEGIPSLFCHCDTCKQSRRLGGKNIRTRTSVLIDQVLKVDFPPDTYYHFLRDGIDLDQVQDLLLTHSHSDHLYAEDLVIRAKGYAQYDESRQIHIYGHDLPIRSCKELLESEQHHYQMHRILLFETIQTQTAVVTPLLASHAPNETCLVYFIEKDGKAILYGHDSGWFPNSTWDWLKGKKLDLAILECTTGNAARCSGHMNVEDVLGTRDWLMEQDVMKANGKVVVTHFSHNAHLLHDDLVQIFEPNDVIVAYDGMQIDF
ncbi:MBL fold metallo-hydrolase [Paenibacillus sp. N1-5-1-14]|uniref:MBL fold metallo-hydrolase n=1 Tax=Paenibacillus radicibacter TaxID=2972488 RepID=UPI002158D57C|nr:MBL fold metallo-hydrolase [Paenibacillus radicibacter]MCR8643398.1 MBL fold metallo-hydrolase [Paenibacillus radicibacter]